MGAARGSIGVALLRQRVRYGSAGANKQWTKDLLVFVVACHKKNGVPFFAPLSLRKDHVESILGRQKPCGETAGVSTAAVFPAVEEGRVRWAMLPSNVRACGGSLARCLVCPVY